MGKTYGRMFETFPRYEPLEIKSRPIYPQLCAPQVEVFTFQLTIHIPALREQVFWCMTKAYIVSTLLMYCTVTSRRSGDKVCSVHIEFPNITKQSYKKHLRPGEAGNPKSEYLNPKQRHIMDD